MVKIEDRVSQFYLWSLNFLEILTYLVQINPFRKKFYYDPNIL